MTSESEMERGSGKSVLMVSGGLDSYLAYRLFKPDALVFCAAGHRYEKRELESVGRLWPGGEVRVDRTLSLGTWERGDAIVPLRNLMFACVGSRYGDRVWLGSLLGEVNWDKTPEFYWTASAAISHCYRRSYWCEGRTVSVESPTAGMTKATLLKEAMEKAGVTREDVARTVSCYSEQGFCGRCPSCFKRAVATKLNGWVEQYAQDPLASVGAFRALVKAVNGDYQHERCEEIKAAMSYHGEIVEVLERTAGGGSGG